MEEQRQQLVGGGVGVRHENQQVVGGVLRLRDSTDADFSLDLQIQD